MARLEVININRIEISVIIVQPEPRNSAENISIQELHILFLNPSIFENYYLILLNIKWNSASVVSTCINSSKFVVDFQFQNYSRQLQIRNYNQLLVFTPMVFLYINCDKTPLVFLYIICDKTCHTTSSLNFIFSYMSKI